MLRSSKLYVLLAALVVSVAGFAVSPATAVVHSCQSTNFANGGFDGTGANCPTGVIFANTPDPTSNSAPNLQDKTVNGSPLLGSFSAAGTFLGTGNIGDFTITSVGGLSGTWSYVAGLGDLLPKWIEINAGSNWFLVSVADGVTSGNWSTCPDGLAGVLCLKNPPGNAAQTLSHIAFFDGASTRGGGGGPAVPLPAALPLFAGGLGVLGLLGWRRKKKMA